MEQESGVMKKKEESLKASKQTSKQEREKERKKERRKTVTSKK